MSHSHRQYTGVPVTLHPCQRVLFSGLKKKCHSYSKECGFAPLTFLKPSYSIKQTLSFCFTGSTFNIFFRETHEEIKQLGEWILLYYWWTEATHFTSLWIGSSGLHLPGPGLACFLYSTTSLRLGLSPAWHSIPLLTPFQPCSLRLWLRSWDKCAPEKGPWLLPG